MFDDFAVFEAVCGILGDFGCCGAELPADHQQHVCTRIDGHAGDHVAAHNDGYVLARWPNVEQPCAS